MFMFKVCSIWIYNSHKAFIVSLSYFKPHMHQKKSIIMIHRLAPTLKPLTGEAHITDLPGKHWVLAFKWKLSRDINHINKFQVTATSSAFLRNSCRTWQTVQAVETARLPADSVFGHNMGQNKPIHCTDSMQRARQHGALQNITCCTDRSEPFRWNKRDLHNGCF